MGIGLHLTRHGFWDRMVIDDEGVVSSLSEGMRVQMKKLILEGH